MAKRRRYQLGTCKQSAAEAADCQYPRLALTRNVEMPSRSVFRVA
jgi:hypothetical protein